MKHARSFAPGKINPTLVLIERRLDGFHELDLSLLALDLGDRLDLAPSKAAIGSLRLSGPLAGADVPSGPENLAWRGARAMLELARRQGLRDLPSDFDLGLRKELPSQAGLGGGSSDAAAAALAACKLLGLQPQAPEVAAALADLGSDCAFFLAARSSGHARGRGRGERIEVQPALPAELGIAVLAPRVGASTSAVYAAVGELGPAARNRERAERVWAAWQGARTLERRRAALCNDLEAAALRAVPELVRWRALLDTHDAAHFRLSGSGSSFFGLFETAEEATPALRSLVAAAAAQGLELRGHWVARPSGNGVRILE